MVLILRGPFAALDSFDLRVHSEVRAPFAFCHAVAWLSSFPLAISPFLLDPSPFSLGGFPKFGPQPLLALLVVCSPLAPVSTSRTCTKSLPVLNSRQLQGPVGRFPVSSNAAHQERNSITLLLRTFNGSPCSSYKAQTQGGVHGPSCLQRTQRETDGHMGRDNAKLEVQRGGKEMICGKEAGHVHPSMGRWETAASPPPPSLTPGSHHPH